MNNKNLLTVVLVTIVFVGLSPGVMAAKSTKNFDNPSHKDPKLELLRLRNEGVAQYESGVGHKKSLVLFEKALALNPDSAIEHFNVAVALKKQNKIKAALQQLDKAITLAPSFAHTYYTKGLIFKDSEAQKKALQLFQTAAKYAPTDASIYYQQSRIFRDLERDADTLQAVVKTLSLDPYHTGALYQLYMYHQQNGDTDKSKEIFKEFSRIKRAISKTRKEINPDETLLARPIGGNNDAILSAGAAEPFTVAFDKGVLIGEGLKKFQAIDNEASGIMFVGLTKDNKFTLFKKSGSTAYQEDVLFRHNAPIKTFKVSRFSVKKAAQILFLADDGLFLSDAIAAKAKVVKLADTITKDFTLADIDHDGDIDVLGDGFQTILLNRGNGTFKTKHNVLQTIKKNITLKDPKLLVTSDFRNKILFDYFFINTQNDVQILRSDMGGKHKLVTLAELSGTSDVKQLLRADVNNDGLNDVIAISDDSVFLYENQGQLRFQSKTMVVDKRWREKGIANGMVIDVNNDGYKDITLHLNNQQVIVLKNTSGNVFEPEAVVADDKIGVGVFGVQNVDLNGDGKLDIVGLNRDGALVATLNRVKSTGRWAKFSLTGKRSPPTGLNTTIEVRHGPYYTKYESDGGTMLIPLGKHDYAEIVRITWPNGFVENKFKVDANSRWTFEESERISGSCPSIFVWNGQRYEYLTDAFISGPMGVPISDQQYFPIDNDEYIKIPGHMVHLEQGQVKLVVTEELREAVYLDQVKLFAVDHPSEQTIYPNEFLDPMVEPEFKVLASAHAEPISHAVDHNGKDVTQLIAHHDRQYPHGFSKTEYTGYASEQSIELTLTPLQLRARNLRLFLTGWFYYFDSTSLMSSYQRDDFKMIWPVVQAYVNGQWQTVKRIGIPPGKDKTVMVDLQDALPDGTEKLRLYTNVELYWDQVLIDTAPIVSPRVTMTELPLQAARLRFHGFSTLEKKNTMMPQPDRFDYHKVNYRALWNPLDGIYTRYGHVEPVVDQEDSQMVIFGSGDELTLSLNGTQLPALAPGWSRDYFLYLNGYVKDGDRYTAFPYHVEPVPVADLKQYPFINDERVLSIKNSDGYRRYQDHYLSRHPMHFTGLKSPVQ